MLSCNPLEFSLRELILMAEGLRKEMWTHTSQKLALTYNAHAKRPISPDELNPCRVNLPHFSGADVKNIASIWAGNGKS